MHSKYVILNYMISDNRKIWFEAVKLPVMIIAAASVMISLGYGLCPSVLQGGRILGTANKIGNLLFQAGGIFYYHMDMVLCVGLVYGLCHKDKYALLAALLCVLCAQQIINPISAFLSFPESSLKAAAFTFYPQPFAGILCAWIIWIVFRRKQRITGLLISFSVCAAALTAWYCIYPYLFAIAFDIGAFLFGKGTAGAVIYNMLDRTLSFTGLNQGMFQAVMKDTWGFGEMNAFWGYRTQAETNWPLGVFMSGCMPVVTAGIPYLLSQEYKKELSLSEKTLIVLLAAASFTGGLTEGVEILLILYSFKNFALYIILYGISSALVVFSGFRAGYALHGGLIDFFFSALVPGSQRLWMIIILSLLMVGICRLLKMYIK